MKELFELGRVLKNAFEIDLISVLSSNCNGIPPAAEEEYSVA